MKKHKEAVKSAPNGTFSKKEVRDAFVAQTLKHEKLDKNGKKALSQYFQHTGEVPTGLKGKA